MHSILILNRFVPELTKEERQYGYFQQDLALAHKASKSMVAISDAFGDKS
jgi:hypothetical protein